MPGTERSGRRILIRSDGIKLPRLGKSESSVRSFLAAIAQHVGAGSLDPRVADTMIAAAKGSLQAMRQHRQHSELNSLKELVERAESVVLAGQAHEVADREHAVSPTNGSARSSERPLLAD